MSLKERVLNQFAQELGYADWNEAKEDWSSSTVQDCERLATIAEELQEATKDV